MQNLHRKAENAFFFEVYEQILCPLKKKYPILNPIYKDSNYGREKEKCSGW